jgi:hypothetical protein
MAFLHGWAIAIGVAAVGLPVLVHWLTRPRPLRLPLSTLRFVRQVIQDRRARHRLRDLLILSLRTLAVLLLALAVARPLWGSRSLVSDQNAGEAVRVVLLDVSQSMAALDGAAQAIERARTIAAGYLRYRPGLQANLVLCGAGSRAVFEQVSTNFEVLRQELASCRALAERLDANRALDVAAGMLAAASPADARRRELVVVSDFQRTSWGSADFSRLPKGVQIQLESVAVRQTPPNVAILRAEARAHSARDRMVQLEVDVGNYTGAARKIAVDVVLGDTTRRLSGACAAGRRTTLTDELELGARGWLWGEARLVGVDDALEADNVRPMVVEVRNRPQYLLLTREAAGRRPTSSYFLQAALLAHESSEASGAGKLLRVDPADLQPQALAPANLVFLDHPGKLSDDAVRLLADLLYRGRPMVYVAGEPVDAINLKRLCEAARGGLRMPVEFQPPPAGQARRDLFLAAVRRDEPPFRVFGDQLDAVIGRLRFAGGLGSRRLEGGVEDEVLATYNDGTACLVLASSGAGALAVLNADLAASDLVKSGAFVPLLAELVEQLLDRNRGGQTALCGEPLVVNLPAEIRSTPGLQIVGPRPAAPAGEAQPLGELVDEGTALVWRWASPSAPGVYRVVDHGATRFAMTVNIPPEESQLESLPAEVLTQRLSGGRDIYYSRQAEGNDRRDDLWKWFAAACVLAMTGEIASLLAFRT